MKDSRIVVKIFSRSRRCKVNQTRKCGIKSRAGLRMLHAVTAYTLMLKRFARPGKPFY